MTPVPIAGLGMPVLFRVHKQQDSDKDVDYPGFVYKLYEDEPNYVGITVLFDGIPTRYGKVAYSEEPKGNCWRL